MRRLLVFILFVSIPSFGIDFTQQDKQAHFIAGFAIGMTSNSILKKAAPNMDPLARAFVGVLAATVIGVGKEFIDQYPDPNDVNATILGGAFTAPIIIPFDI